MNPQNLQPGQRWISQTEPELGLGTLLQIQPNHITIHYPAANQHRQYTPNNPPIQRVHFRPGDQITTNQNQTITIQKTTQQNGIITYHGQHNNQPIQIPETHLNDQIRFNRPQDRILHNQTDPLQSYHLRQQAALHRHQRNQAPHRGLGTGRVALIPHQLYIAHQVTNRHAPRVLLSDEIGLGKTIEAGLILHRLHITGRAQRTLILVPESLLHQWFIEILRKFNLHLNIFDEQRCQATEQNSNPFLQNQLILTHPQLLTQNQNRLQQALQTPWDLLIIDEAHHIQYNPTKPDPQYLAIQQLSQKTQSLLLLTATPEQLGPQSHFARLQLLDPQRYPDYQTYQKQTQHYQHIATLANQLTQNQPLNTQTQKQLQKLTQQPPPKTPQQKQQTLNTLIDLHGPGRVIFRNTRNTITGFPTRIPHLIPLDPTPNTDPQQQIQNHIQEHNQDIQNQTTKTPPNLTKDPRIHWLLKHLKQTKPQKTLLITTTTQKTIAIQKALQQHTNIKTALFNQNIQLIQRDRNAAYFAEPDGAQLLITSEIGSEGRNFQFANQLILFDLPLNPELLEQRIGRLDRIGQKNDIHIHIPYLKQSPQETLAHWFHHALNAIQTHLPGANQLLRKLQKPLLQLAAQYPTLPKKQAQQQLNQLLTQTKNQRQQLTQQLQQGRNRLLELSSNNPTTAQQLQHQIQQDDQSPQLQNFLNHTFEHFGIQSEQLNQHTHRLDPTHLTTDAFPAIPTQGTLITYHRQHALHNEHIQLITWDHPITTGALDLILTTQLGNAAFALQPNQPQPGLILQTTYELTPTADPKHQADRFLPRTPIPITINHKLQPIPTDQIPPFNTLKNTPPYRLLDNPQVKNQLLPKMLNHTQQLAQQQAQQTIQSKTKHMNQTLNQEINRLQTLQKTNPNIRPIEIQLAKQQKTTLNQTLKQAPLRLDSILLIWQTPDPS